MAKEVIFKGDYFYYLAYGSNINMEQMSRRCPHAYPVGKAMLEDYQLSFKGSSTGNYLTIDKRKGSMVPVIVWRVDRQDIDALNMYEGYPNLYGIKRFKNVEIEPFIGEIQTLDCFAYIMNKGRTYGMPSFGYVKCVSDGYERFGIDHRFMDSALEYTRERIKKIG